MWASFPKHRVQICHKDRPTDSLFSIPSNMCKVPLLSSPASQCLRRESGSRKKISEGVEIQNKPLRKLHVMKDRLRKAFTFLPLMATGLGLREILQRETPHIPFFFLFFFLICRCRYCSLLRRYLSSPNFYSFASLLLPLVSSYYYLTEGLIHLVISLANILIPTVS